MAMYRAKQEGRNRFEFFDVSLDHLRRSGFERRKRLAEAAEKGELRLHYQPVINLRSGRIESFEALLRWQDPEIGTLVLPMDFLPAIMDTGLIVGIGSWVLEQAINQVSSWQGMGLDLNVSVNVALRQLGDPDFPERLKSLFGDHPGVAPHKVELEILETSAISDMHQIQQTLTACRDLGVRLSLDDFGTGYSSLSYLKNLPIDLLKIDQSFVSGMLENRGNIAVIRSIVSMSRIFGREVVAEGMESALQGRMLLSMGCNLAQGYAIAEPMPGERIPEWVEGWSRNPDWMEHLH